MRMRVLTHTSKGKLLALADQITKQLEADKPTDVIPPAYYPDGERLVVIVCDAKNKVNDAFGRFLRSIKRSISANVAFLVDGTPENAKKLIDMANANGAHVFEDNVLYMNGGLPFKFLRKVTPEESEKVAAWVKYIRENLA